MALPGNLKRLTVAFYLQGLVPHAMPNDSPLSLIQGLFRQTPEPVRKPDLDGDHRGGLPLAGGQDGGEAGIRPRAIGGTGVPEVPGLGSGPTNLASRTLGTPCNPRNPGTPEPYN